MNRPDRFWKTIDVLATAYMQGTLQAYDCSACAVGNMIAAEKEGCEAGKPIERWPSDHSGDPNRQWAQITGMIRANYELKPSELPEAATCLSYTNAELALIENTLMNNWEDSEGKWQPFKALMEVVDVLFDIHDVQDEDLRGQAKSAFEGDHNTVEEIL